MDPEEMADAYLREADALASGKRYEEAIAGYDRAIGVYPECSEAWTNKASVLRLMGKLQEALESAEKALEIGQSAYGQNCARCHGLDAISGGIAPDLRYLETGDSGDEWFVQRFQHGSSRDGKVYMPPFGEVLGQKAGWAIRTWIESKHTEE